MKLHMSALTEMRMATHEMHQLLECTLAVARPDAGRDDFIFYLQDLWGWMLPFESRLWQAPWPQEMRPLDRAGKLAWIESDLRSTGFGDEAITAIPLAPFAPDLGCMERRFGVAYVVEGAQLGTKVLARRLAPKLDGWEPRWLAGYGEENARNWRAFIECAERCLVTGAARQAAAEAAVETFAALADWFGARQGERCQQRNETLLVHTG